jgi:hypothetical protein
MCAISIYELDGLGGQLPRGGEKVCDGGVTQGQQDERCIREPYGRSERKGCVPELERSERKGSVSEKKTVPSREERLPRREFPKYLGNRLHRCETNLALSMHLKKL